MQPPSFVSPAFPDLTFDAIDGMNHRGVARLILDGYLELEKSFPIDAIEAHYAQKAIVCRDAAQPIGIATYSVEPSGSLYVHLLFIRSEWRKSFIQAAGAPRKRGEDHVHGPSGQHAHARNCEKSGL